MKPLIFLLYFTLLLPCGEALAQGWQWGISNNQPFTGVIEASEIATDRFGNVFSGGNTFGGDSVTIGAFTIYDTVSIRGVLVVKSDPFGNVLWVFHVQNGFSELKGIATDISGNLYIVGLYFDTFCTVGTFTLVNDTPDHGVTFLAKLSTTGSVMWAHNIVHSDGFMRSGVGVDNAGYVYVAKCCHPELTNAG